MDVSTSKVISPEPSLFPQKKNLLLTSSSSVALKVHADERIIPMNKVDSVNYENEKHHIQNLSKVINIDEKKVKESSMDDYTPHLKTSSVIHKIKAKNKIDSIIGKKMDFSSDTVPSKELLIKKHEKLMNGSESVVITKENKEGNPIIMEQSKTKFEIGIKIGKISSMEKLPEKNIKSERNILETLVPINKIELPNLKKSIIIENDVLKGDEKINHSLVSTIIKKEELNTNEVKKTSIVLNRNNIDNIVVNHNNIEKVSNIITRVQSPLPHLSNKIEKIEEISVISQHTSPTFSKISSKTSKSILERSPIAVHTGVPIAVHTGVPIAVHTGKPIVVHTGEHVIARNSRGKTVSAERTSNDVTVPNLNNFACSDTVDPFLGESVENFVPPKNADFLSKNEWTEAVKQMLSKISKLQVGGDKLKKILNEEIVLLSKLRKNLFCKYV